MSVHGSSTKLPLPERSQTRMSADAKIKELGLELPPAPAPMGVYKPIVITGSLAYLSGHGPVLQDGSMMSGRVGDDLDLDHEFGLRQRRYEQQCRGRLVIAEESVAGGAHGAHLTLVQIVDVDVD